MYRSLKNRKKATRNSITTFYVWQAKLLQDVKLDIQLFCT